MSFAALAMVLIHAALYGVVKEADEGTEAHIYQLLMAAQIPLIVLFVFKWMPKEHKRAFWILTLQAAGWLAAIAAAYWLT